MMREIKYKAVIKLPDKTMVTPTLGWIDFGAKECAWTTVLGEIGEFDENISSYDKLIQYTGLKDAYGKEIYEGDIVKHFGDEVLMVKWIEEESRFYCLSNYGLENDLMVGAKLSKYSVKNLEVIGNIYDEPELFNIKEGELNELF